MDWNAPPQEELDKPKDPPHDEGTFKAVVTNATADKTKNGKAMIRYTFKTAKGKVNGHLIYSPESDGARRMWFKQLANMQVGKAFLDDGPELDEVALACIKAKVLIRVKHEEYEGSPFAKVDYIDEVPAEKPDEPRWDEND